jgi:hypothetical protein
MATSLSWTMMATSLPWTTMATSLLLTDDGPEFSVIFPYLAHC